MTTTSKLAPNTDNLFIGKGALYFDRFDTNGNKTGELDLGNATAYGIQLAQTMKDHITSRHNIKKVDLSVAVEEKWTGKFNLEEYSVENLNLAFRGILTPRYLVQGPGTISSGSPVVVNAVKSRWTPILMPGSVESIRNITGGTVVVKNGATTFTEGKDYKIDYQVGRIMVLQDGAIYPSEPLSISLSYGAVNQQVISPVTPSLDVKGFMRFVPDNTQGPNYMSELWSVVLKCTSEIGFITDDFGKIPFEIELEEDDLTRSHVLTDPYFRITELRPTLINS